MIDERGNLHLTDAEYLIFSDLPRSRCGLRFDEAMRFLVEKRLARRIEAMDLGSFASYLYQLRNGPNAEDELSTIVDILTINVTYFFRERSQLDALIGHVIPELLSRAARRHRPVSIWSAGCSSGEEPFSIVILAREAGLVPGRDYRVVA